MNTQIFAKYVITKCYQDNNPVTNMKLQKILYLLWIDYYDKYEKSLFMPEFSAMKLGPVVVNVFYDYHLYLGNPIKEVFDIDLKNLRNNQKKYVDERIEYYNSMSTWDLINISKQSKPWIKAFNKGKGSYITLPPFQCRKPYKSKYGVMNNNEKNHRYYCCFGNYRGFNCRNFRT